MSQLSYEGMFKYQNELELTCQQIPLSRRAKQHTHCQIPVDLGDPHMKVETEENQQDPSHHKCTAAYELKKVEAFARGTLHDGLDANECNQGQNLTRK